MSDTTSAPLEAIKGEPYTPPGRTAVFDVPAYDQIADLQALFKQFADTAAAYTEAGGGPLVDKTGSFTITNAADCFKTYLVTSNTVSTITVPDATTLTEGVRFNVIQGGPARASVSGPNVVGLSSTSGQYQGLTAVVHEGKWWCVPFGSSGGGGGGGPIPIFNISADLTLDVDNVGGMVCGDATLKNLNVTVPADDGTIPIGSAIVVTNIGSNSKNSVTLVAGPGVILQDRSDTIIKRYGIVTLVKRAANIWLLSAGSGGGKVVPPGAPTLRQVFPASAGFIAAWDAPSDEGSAPINNYFVETSTDTLSWNLVDTTDASTFTAQVGGLTPGVKILVRVRAISAAGIGDPSDAIEVIPNEGHDEAEGGTVTTFEDNGRLFRHHTFTEDGVFKVNNSVGPIRIMLLGGSGSGGAFTGGPQGMGGGGAGMVEGFVEIPVGSWTVKVGKRGGDTYELEPAGSTSVSLPGGKPTAGGASYSTAGVGNADSLPGLTAHKGGDGPAGSGFSYTLETVSERWCGGGGQGGNTAAGQAGVDGGGNGGYGSSGILGHGEMGSPGVRGGGSGGSGNDPIQSSLNWPKGTAGSAHFIYEIAPFNDAEGGVEKEIADYNGTGQTWRTHEFSSAGTLRVKRADNLFRVLVVGGGSNGGEGGPYCAVGSRGASGEAKETSIVLMAGDINVTVGGPGGTSTIGTASASGAANTARIISSITGASIQYPAPGGSDGPCGSDGNQRGGNGTVPGGEGGGGGGISNDSPFKPGPGGSGAPGRVIVAYQIG